MGIILFLVDTSASMNQRTFLGTSYLDIAKGAIDTFMKVRTHVWVRAGIRLSRGSYACVIHGCVCVRMQYRSRDPASRGDRYMLVTFDEPPNAVKVRLSLDVVANSAKPFCMPCFYTRMYMYIVTCGWLLSLARARVYT